MKKYCIWLGLAGVLCTPAVQAALNLDYNVGTVTLSDGPGNTGGGEFVAATSFYGSFNTFCLERFEYFNYGVEYNVNINGSAVLGGNGKFAGGDALGVSDGTLDAVGDPISVGTAWLYRQFVNNTLAGYAYNNAAARVASANELQIALWMLEEEVGTSSSLYDSNNDYWQLAQTVFSGNAMDDAAVGQFGVYVMNLHNSPTGQDQLIAEVPEPTTIVAGALLLLPFGVSALRIIRRRVV